MRPTVMRPALMRRAAGWVFAASLAGIWLGCPPRAHAQLPPPEPPPTQRSVHLSTPECERLPFAQDRLRALLTLELEVDGASLVEASAADVVVRYEPIPCEAGTTEFLVHVRPAIGAERNARVSLAEVPLATVPRALALEIVETLRGARGEGEPSSPPDRLAEEVTAAESTAAEVAPHAAPVGSREAPEERAESDGSPPPPQPPGAPAGPPAGPPTRFGATVHMRNTPETGALLFGPRVFVDLPLGHELPLALRLDLSTAYGTAAGDLALGWIGGGVTLSFWARAVQDLALRFGARLFVGHGWAFEPEANAAARVSDDVQVGLGVLVATEVRLVPGVTLVVEAEVGTHLLGLEYELAAGRSGFVGAYWGVDVGLAFD